MNNLGEDSAGLIGLLIVLARRKKLILGFTVTAAAVSLVVSLLMPNVYQATTKLLPPQQAQSGAAALLSQLGGAAGLASGLSGMKNPSDLYIGMLKSRTVADRLVDKFGLKTVYDVKLSEQARQKLENNTLISTGKDGLITIDVEDQDPKRVAALTNAYVSELERLTTSLAITEAAQRRLFFQKELELAKNNLAAAETALKSGLDSDGVISVDVESRAIVETVERLRAQISAKEIELNSQRAFLTDGNPVQQRTQEQLTSLRNQLSKLENGRNPNFTENGSSTENRSGFKNIKLLRDVKYYQMLYELLAKQFEAARLDEAKDPAVVQVLDKALEPERKLKPKRAVIVILSTLFALFCAIAWVFVQEAKRRMLQSPDIANRWMTLKTQLRFSRN